MLEMELTYRSTRDGYMHSDTRGSWYKRALFNYPWIPDRSRIPSINSTQKTEKITVCTKIVSISRLVEEQYPQDRVKIGRLCALRHRLRSGENVIGLQIDTLRDCRCKLSARPLAVRGKIQPIVNAHYPDPLSDLCGPARPEPYTPQPISGGSAVHALRRCRCHPARPPALRKRSAQRRPVVQAGENKVQSAPAASVSIIAVENMSNKERPFPTETMGNGLTGHQQTKMLS